MLLLKSSEHYNYSLGLLVPRGPQGVLERKGTLCELLVRGLCLGGRRVGVTDRSLLIQSCAPPKWIKCKGLFVAKFGHFLKEPLVQPWLASVIMGR